jgi:hypothetical protein
MNPLQPVSGAAPNPTAFVTTINPTGSALVYSTYLGGSTFDTGNGIAVDSTGNAYVMGYTVSTDFPTTNPVQPANGGNGDVFITRLNPAGSALVYSTYLGGSGYDQGSGIAVDAAGNAYVTGYTESINFPTTPGAFQTICNRGSRCIEYEDAFVTKLNSSGSVLLCSTYLGGTKSDEGRAIAVDSGGNAYITGSTDSTNFPTKNPLQPTYGGSGDAVVTKIDTRVVPATTLSSSPNPSTYGQAVTFTAAVTSNIGAPPDGETVKFMKGTTVLRTVALSGGLASFVTSTLPVGNNLIKAVYGGDASFLGSKVEHSEPGGKQSHDCDHFGFLAESFKRWPTRDLHGEGDAAVQRYRRRVSDLLRWHDSPEDGDPEQSGGKVHNCDANLRHAQHHGGIQRQQQL